ncbi:hypothetical protein [Fodinicola acaciae]|uniref:hypothetical protein n=1 Tax=Fodinicola acaciae TaxID=2681555 RepID=UPI0013D0DB8C|nr:hypothetical protein [Fodinicola acaciae]
MASSLAEREQQYVDTWQQLQAILDAKATVRRRITWRDGSLSELALQLHDLVQREAVLCDRLADFWTVDDEIHSALASWNWAGYLNKLAAQRYVETLWLAQFGLTSIEVPA